MNIQIFTNIGNMINNAVKAALLSVQNGWVSGLLSAANARLILYFTIYGYVILEDLLILNAVE